MQPSSRAGTAHAAAPSSARAAAVAALALLLAAVVVAVVAVTSGSVWRLAVATAAVLASVMAAWSAVSHRGGPRMVALVATVAGMAVVVVTVVTSRYRGLALAATVLLMALAGAVAGYALSSARDPGDPPAEGVSPPRHPVLIMNPRSGGGKVRRHRLAEECRARGIGTVELSPGDDLRALAVECIDRGADAIGMAGGDGSQALVASVAADRCIPYVCVPAGTRNHLALDLGIDREDVVGALDAFADGIERRVDLATVNGRVFVNNASMGLYAKIVRSEEYRAAKLETAAAMLPDLLGPGAEPFDLRFRTPTGTQWPYAHMLLVSNNPYRLDHLLGSGVRSRMDSGMLGIAAVRIDGPGAAAAFVGLEAAGRVRSFPGWTEWSAPSFRVDSSGPVDIGIDGEAVSMDPPLLFAIRPGALRVRLPRPAARSAAHNGKARLDRSGIWRLVLLAAGRPQPPGD